MRILLLTWYCLGNLLASNCVFKLNRDAVVGDYIPFQPKVGTQPFSNYLQLSLNFEYFSPLLQAINNTVGVPPLKTRNEAHITVISPVEFDRVLSRVGITMSEINQIAIDNLIQSSYIDPACIGRDKLTIDNVPQEVYNIVLRNKHDFIAIRRRVFELYLTKGGEGSLFEPEAFWGHITLGFLNRDVFIEDGVYKGLNSCWGKLKLVRSKAYPHHGHHSQPQKF